MIRIPLTYFNTLFGHALIDDSRELLAGLGRYSITLPKAVRNTVGRGANKRPDVLLAMLAEDESVRSRCSPFLSACKTQIKLVHLVLRPELANIILAGGSIQDLNDLRLQIGRVVHANNDMTDCRIENLRELSITEAIE